MRLAGHRTSLALEGSYWRGLERIAKYRQTSLPKVIESIDTLRTTNPPGEGIVIDNTMSLASAVRTYLFELASQKLETMEREEALRIERGRRSFGE